MILLKRYLIKKFFKNFIIVFVSIISLFVIIGLVTNVNYFRGIPLIGLFYYVLTKTVLSIYLLFPTILLISFTITIINLLNSNYLVIIYSLGYSKKTVFNLFFRFSFYLTIIFILIHFTAISKYYVYSFNFNPTINNNYFSTKNSHYYIGGYQLNAGIGNNVTIFNTNNSSVTNIINAKKLYINNKSMTLHEANILKLDQNLTFDKGFTVTNKNSIVMNRINVERIIKLNKNITNFTTIDIIKSLIINNNNEDKKHFLRGFMYFFTIFPLFTPFILIFIFKIIPINSRMNTLIQFTLKGILISILSWGFLHILSQFSIYSNLPLAVNIIILILIAIYSTYTYMKTLNN